MGAKTGENKTEVIKIAMTRTLRDKCNSARLEGAHYQEAESVFLGYLIALGITRYEKSVLPIEKGEDEDEASHSGSRAASGQ